MAIIEERIINIETAVNNIGSRLITIEDNISKSQDRILELSKRMDTMDSLIQSLSGNLSSLQNQIESMSNANSKDLSEYISKLELEEKWEAFEEEVYGVINTYKDQVTNLKNDFTNYVNESEIASIDGDNVEVIDFHIGEVQ